MAWRPSRYLIEGELDNMRRGKVTGWMRYAGLDNRVTVDLDGEFHRDIRGTKIHFHGDADATLDETKASSYFSLFATHQTGKVGDITAGLPPRDYVAYPYIEWFSDQNGRVVLELKPQQLEVIGTPIPACESDPVSRDEQRYNLTEFLHEAGEALGRSTGKDSDAPESNEDPDHPDDTNTRNGGGQG